MLLEKQHDAIESSGLGAGNSFKIEASAKAFEILSSNLYQDKQLAVIRELSCNAADANKSVGKSVADILIHLPTYSEPYFSVRDQGPGLSDEDVKHLYTTYFASTKSNSNAYIGGFGLGSKSPFAVVDQFTVTSWHGGRKRTYVCFKDGGIPNINAVGDEASDEPTGLLVHVSAASGSFSRWSDKAFQFFNWWQTPPSLTSGSLAHAFYMEPDNLLIASPQQHNGLPIWAFLKSPTNPTVLMGGVPYSLEVGAVVGLPPEVVTALANQPIVLTFDVGQVQIAPSREALSYDPATCAAISARLKMIYAEVRKQVEGRLAAATSLYEARQLMYADAGDQSNLSKLLKLGKTAGSKFAATWRGKAVERAVYLEPDTDFTPPIQVALYNKAYYRTTWRHESPNAFCKFGHNINQHSGLDYIYVWTPTVTGKVYRTLKHDHETKYSANGKRTEGAYILLVGSTFDVVAKTIEDAGFPPLTNIADYADPPKMIGSKSGAYAAKTTGYVISGSGYTRTESPIDLKGGGFYVEFEDGHPRFSINYVNPLAAMLDATKPIIGLAKRKLAVQKLQAALLKNGWTPLNWSRVAEVPDPTIEHIYARFSSGLGQWQGSTDILRWLAAFKPDAGAVVPPDFQLLVDEASYLVNPAAITSSGGANVFESHFTPTQLAAKLRGEQRWAKMKADLAAFSVIHPLLKALTFSETSPSASAILPYLNR